MVIILDGELGSCIFLTSLKLAWKTATLLALVTAKHCSHYPGCMLIVSTFFPENHAASFVPAFGSKTNWLGHPLPQICIESHSNVNLYPVFHLKAYLQHADLFWKNPNCYQLSSLFLSNSRQHMSVYAKMHCKSAYIFRCGPKCCSICSYGRWCFPSIHSACG